MSRSFGLVDEKLAEADFFLEKLASSGFNFFEARCYFSAFVAAARTVTFSLQGVMADVDGFRDWYARQQDALKKDKLARFFHNARTESQHLGISPVNAGTTRRGQDGASEVRFHFCSGLLGQPLADIPEEDVVSACRRYLTTIVGVLHECYRRFGTVIDPDQYYTLENLKRLGLTLENVEEELGYPRGWTALGPGGDEDRLRLLRREISPADVDWLFEKYLGKSRLTD